MPDNEPRQESVNEDTGSTSAATTLLPGAREPYTADSEGIPLWASPVEHEDAMEAFCKVVRYWVDNGRFDDIRCKAEQEPGTIGEFIEAGLSWLWHMVVKIDPD